MADPDPAANTANTFTINLDDTSPTIIYSPAEHNSQNSSNGWIVSNRVLPDANIEASLHVTATDGASLAIKWNGTAITLYGDFIPSNNPPPQADLATYTVYLDGIPTTNYGSSFASPSDFADNVLVSFTNLTYGQHTIELVVHNPENVMDGSVSLQFDRAILSSGVPPPWSAGTSPETTIFPDVEVSYKGQWSFERDLLPGSDDAFHASNNVGDRASFLFNGTAISISGLTTSVSGSYNVSLDTEPPMTLSAESSVNSSAPTVLYYRTGLDPTVMHKLQVINVGGDSSASFLAMGSVNVTSVGLVGTSPPMARLSHGAIAGIAVAASIAFLVLIALTAFCARRRWRTTRRKQELIVNPRLGRLRRLSFLGRSIRSGHSHHSQHSADGERDPHFSPKAQVMETGVLDIRARKEAGEVEDIEVARGIHEVRHASKNSDGSFSIDLPELPQRGYTPVRSSPSHLQSQSPDAIPRRQSPPALQLQMKPRGPRSMHASLPMHQRDSSRGILLANMYRSSSEERDDTNASAVPDAGEGAAMSRMLHLQADHISPFRVSFEDEPYETTVQRREGRHTSAGAVSLPQSLRLALSFGQVPGYANVPGLPNVTVTHSTPITPITPVTPMADTRDREHHLSFLDLDSSTSGSQRSDVRSTRQSGSNSTRSSSKSRYDPSTTTDYGSLLPDRRISLGLSMAIGGGPTSSRPSLSPDISLQPVSLPAESSPHEPVSVIPEDASQPTDPEAQGQTIEYIPSPTESIPHTVSDIHFRHSSYSTISFATDSRRASAMQRHPPLPGSPTAPVPQPEPKPFIVQKLLGMAPEGSGPATPYSSPVTPGFGSAGPSGGGRGSIGGRGSVQPTYTPPPSSMSQSFMKRPK